jgi:hypothetical protein
MLKLFKSLTKGNKMSKLMISQTNISSLKPCKDRFDNYVKFYGNRKFTPKQFMGLKNITHKDKLWVAFHMLPSDKVRVVAGEIAKSVLHIYESKYPNDDRPRKAIECALTGKSNKNTAASAYAASAASADDAADAAAAAASAADTAYTTSAYAAYAAAAYAVYAKPNARSVQEKLIRTIVLKYWK